jgi:hypothetical protein
MMFVVSRCVVYLHIDTFDDCMNTNKTEDMFDEQTNTSIDDDLTSRVCEKQDTNKFVTVISMYVLDNKKRSTLSSFTYNSTKVRKIIIIIVIDVNIACSKYATSYGNSCTYSRQSTSYRTQSSVNIDDGKHQSVSFVVISIE